MLRHIRGDELDDIALEAADDALVSVLTRRDELLRALEEAIVTALTPHQRQVLVTVALNGVPVDVLAEHLGRTRGALYKTLHDARRRLRRHLGEAGFALDTTQGGDI